MRFVRTPTSDRRTQRDPADLPAPEIRNAAKSHLQGPLTQADFERIGRLTAGTFGISRLGQAISQRMRTALSPLL